MIVIVEGRSLKELKNNLDVILSEITDYNVSYSINKNDIVFEKDEFEYKSYLTITASVYDVDTVYILVLPIDVEKSYMLLKHNADFVDQTKILIFPPFKSFVFIASKETLFGVINNLAYNIVQEYKKNFEETNKKFNPDLLPIYIGDVEQYKIPIKIYEHFHIIYDKVLATLRKNEREP
jgi:hypothetical protein